MCVCVRVCVLYVCDIIQFYTYEGMYHSICDDFHMHFIKSFKIIDFLYII